MKALLLLLALCGCADATGCLANGYAGAPPQRGCVADSFPFGLLGMRAPP